MEFTFGEVANLDQVPEQFRSLYSQSAEGQPFTLGEAYKGVAEAVTGLNGALKAAREDARRRAPVDLSALASWGTDPASIKTAVDAKIQELEELATTKNADGKAALDRLRQEMTRAQEAELNKRKDREAALLGEITDLRVTQAALAEMVDQGAEPKLLMPFIQPELRMTEEAGKFTVVVVDAAGEQRYGPTGLPMTIKELVAEKKANPLTARLFNADQTLGGAGSRQQTRTVPPANRPLTALEKIQQGLNRH